MNWFSGWKIVGVIILIVLIIWFGVQFYAREHFTESENRKVYNLFKNVMKSNGTIHEFKQSLNRGKIKFSENNAISIGGKGNVSFDQYVELLKKYNKNQLNINLIDKIRSQN